MVNLETKASARFICAHIAATAVTGMIRPETMIRHASGHYGGQETRGSLSRARAEIESSMENSQRTKHVSKHPAHLTLLGGNAIYPAFATVEGHE